MINSGVNMKNDGHAEYFNGKKRPSGVRKRDATG